MEGKKIIDQIRKENKDGYLMLSKYGFKEKLDKNGQIYLEMTKNTFKQVMEKCDVS